MPDLSEHYIQSQHNIAFTGAFANQPYADWAITSRFYAAAHLIRAWLRIHGATESELSTHVDVANQMRARQFNKRVTIAYRQLLDLSKEARYECFPVADFQQDVDTAQQLLEEVQRFVEPYIQRNLPAV